MAVSTFVCKGFEAKRCRRRKKRCMATLTGQRGVSAVQGKPGVAAMIEALGEPVATVVAGFAMNDTLHRELTGVNIRVAIHACS